jgi:class 3 adenylate cyclase/FixJ family two-component response regulator
MNILVVDDEERLRRLCAEVLLGAGYQVRTAAGGDEALPLLKDGVDILLTDLDMPGSIGGVELMRRAKAIGPVDVVIMTAFPDVNSTIEAIKGGAYDYLVKPFAAETLRIAVDRCAERRRLSSELQREKHLRERLDQAIEELSRMGRVRDIFGQFTTPEVVKLVLDHPDDFWKRGERREVTVLFADVRKFTPFARRVPPEQAVQSLNGVFEVLVSCITLEGGMVNKFMGDGLMALFGAPAPLDDHAMAAAKAAYRARQMLAFLAQNSDPDALRVGFALNTGDVLAGCLGVRERVEYSVIGQAVNLAARMEKLAAPDEVLLAPETASRVEKFFDLEPRGSHALDGFPEPVTLHRLLHPKPGFTTLP